MTTRWTPALGAMGLLLSATQGAAADEGWVAPNAGFDDGFYLRDSHDNFRLYPRGRLNLDFYGFAGPGVTNVQAPDGSTGLMPRIFVRRFRLELAGDFLQDRFNFYAGADFGGQPLANANGKSQQAAGRAGETPSSTTPRYAPVQAASAAATPADVWINAHAGKELNVMVGQYQAPISMENRTSESYTPFLERNVAIRGFVVPTGKEIGISAWGDLGGGVLTYELGVFGGDGQNRPQADRYFDWFGRVYARPFARRGGLLQKAQIGLSAHHGDRDPKSVGYDYPQITSGQGFVLWDTSYKDSLGRTTHILPSGSQDAIGGELRLPVGRVALQGEAYFVNNHTREALDGYQLTNTERLGQVKGVAWYGQLSFWPLGDAFVDGDPGLTRPRVLDLTKPPGRLQQGLEMLALVAGIDAKYEGASRGGKADVATPSAAIRIYQMGVGANYWWTRFVRASFNYFAYLTPGSGSKDNLAMVPGNVGKTPVAGAHVLHEISGRMAVQF